MTEEENIVDLMGKTKKISCLGCDREKGLLDGGKIWSQNTVGSSYYGICQRKYEN